jgi:hypothetical protein
LLDILHSYIILRKKSCCFHQKIKNKISLVEHFSVWPLEKCTSACIFWGFPEIVNTEEGTRLVDLQYERQNRMGFLLSEGKKRVFRSVFRKNTFDTGASDSYLATCSVSAGCDWPNSCVLLSHSLYGFDSSKLKYNSLIALIKSAWIAQTNCVANACLCWYSTLPKCLVTQHRYIGLILIQWSISPLGAKLDVEAMKRIESVGRFSGWM